MTFLQRLQAHKGGLIHLKTQLYWRWSRVDNNPGRICLILDAAASAATKPTARACSIAGAVAYLLLDGSPQWVWVAKEDMELL